MQSRFPVKDLTTSDGCVIESDKDKANAFNPLKMVVHCLIL